MSAFVAIIPACNEERSIGQLLRSLRRLSDEFLAIVSVNGCHDQTAEVARAVVSTDRRFHVVESTVPGKCLAINRAEQEIPAFLEHAPRFYVDSDVRIDGADLMRLASHLGRPEPMLVSPAIEIDTDGCTMLARLAARGWTMRPYFRSRAFQFVLGVNAAGRQRWGRFPEIIADDAFVASQFASTERCIARDCVVKISVPRDTKAFLGVQRRWIAGDRQLRSHPARAVLPTGKSTQPEPRISGFRRPGDAFATGVYLGLRSTAMLLDRLGARQGVWYRDESTR